MRSPQSYFLVFLLLFGSCAQLQADRGTPTPSVENNKPTFKAAPKVNSGTPNHEQTAKLAMISASPTEPIESVSKPILRTKAIQLETSREEIASVDVLNELCPAILDPKALPRFREGMRALLSNMLPNSKDPVALMSALELDPQYQAALKQAREDSVQFSIDDNRELCIDIVLYPNPTKNGN